jgi:hypothetical protein
MKPPGPDAVSVGLFSTAKWWLPYCCEWGRPDDRGADLADVRLAALVGVEPVRGDGVRGDAPAEVVLLLGGELHVHLLVRVGDARDRRGDHVARAAPAADGVAGQVAGDVAHAAGAEEERGAEDGREEPVGLHGQRPPPSRPSTMNAWIWAFPGW